ncbi:MAG: gliding motility-associated C-terminal domain-containing protein [Bacteroidota bacterium]
MVEKDFIKELFAEKLANAEAPVNPELWNAISAKVATQTAVSAGLSTTAKLIIGLGTAATITVASVLYFNQKEEQPKAENKTLVAKNKQEKENPVPDQDKASDETTQEVAKTAASQAISTEEIHFVIPNVYEEDPQTQEIVGPADSENTGTSDKRDQQNEEVLPVNKTTEKQNPLADKTSKPITQEKGTDKTTLEIGELPNIFTPNNDNENDFFFVPVKGVQDFVLTILDQNNETVFRTTDPNFKWDGRDVRGNLVPSGTKLVYFFTGKSAQGDTISRHNRLEIRY